MNLNLRHAFRLHHIGIGHKRNGTTVHILVHVLHITVISADTGQINSDFSTPMASTSRWADRQDHPKAAPNTAAA